MSQRLLQRLDRQARRRGVQKTPLAERYLEEAVSMAEHPGIVFRDGAGGREAAIAGHRLRVWEVIETVLAEDGNAEAAAAYLSLPLPLVQAAAGYYADHQAEIDAAIQSNDEMAAEAEERWRRQSAAFER